MTRRETLLKFAGLAGGPVFLAGCSMEAINRADAKIRALGPPGTGIQGRNLGKAIQIIVLAQYPSTAEQTQVAEERGRAAVAVIAQRERRKAVVHHSDGGAKPVMVVGNQTLSVNASNAQIAAAALMANLGTTRIVLDTVGDSRQQGARVVSIYDLPEGRVVGNNVYDIKSAPPKNKVVQIGDLGPAVYMGKGT